MQSDLRRVKRIQQRRSLAEVLTAENPIFKTGEIVYEQDTGKFKIGDGKTAWSDLPYYVDAQKITQLIIDNGGGEGGVSAWVYDSDNNTLTPPNDANVEMSGGDIKVNSGRIYLSENISNVFRHLSDTSIVGGKESVQLYVGDASAGVSEDRPVAQAVDDGFEVDPDGEGFKKVVLTDDPRLESSSILDARIVSSSEELTGDACALAVSGSGDIELELPTPTADYKGQAYTFFNTVNDNSLELTISGIMDSGSGTSYILPSATVTTIRCYSLGEDTYGWVVDGWYYGYGLPKPRLLILDDQAFGILRDNGDIDYPTAGQGLFYDGDQMSWQNQIIPVQAGTDLSTARPAGAIVCYWLFDVGTDIGSGGVNVVNSVPGDIYYVAAS